MKKLRLILILLIILMPYQLFGVYFHYTPYSGSMKEIKTEHFIIAFPKGYEAVGRKAAAYAEDAHILLSDFFQWESYERTTLILSPETDSANGMAMPAFRNVIVIYLAQSELENSLNEAADPLWRTIVHEYTHVLHIDQLRGAGWFWRVLFGKLYFPNSATFNWNVEGMATLTESIFSDTGRLRSAYSEALIADAARHHAIPPFCKLIPPYKEFPYGHAVYHFGARFLEYLYTTYGKAKFQAFFIDLSYDFWPFVPMFVLTFKKVYGKKLSELWDEWREYEEIKSSGDDFCSSEITPLTDNQSNIDCFDIADDGSIFYAANGIKSDNYIYRKSGDESEKYRLGLVRDICADGDMLYYTKNVARSDSKSFYDLFVTDMRTHRQRRLTWTGHVNYVAAKNGTVAVVRHKFDSADIEILQNEKNDTIVTFPAIEHIKYIDRISFNSDGSALIFAGKLQNGQKNLYLWRLTDNQCQVILNDTDASSAEWIDDNQISFILRRGQHNCVCEYDLAAGEVRSLLDRDDVYPSMAKVKNGKLYYIGYNYRGEEIYETDIPSECPILTENDIVQRNGFFDSHSDRSQFNQYGVRNYDLDKVSKYKVTMFHFGRYLLPTVWGIIPTTLDSSAYFSDSFSLPFIAPQLMLMNESPTGRLSYTAKLTYDYMKQYPVNDLDVTLRLPCTSIELSWSNWAGGAAVWLNNAVLYSDKPEGERYHFPICFRDALAMTSSFALGGYGAFSVSGIFTHQYSQWSLSKDAESGDLLVKYHKNQIYWLEGLEYRYIIPRAGSSRWNRGFYISTQLYQAPKILDNTELYIADLDVQFRMPVSHKIFQFTALQTGFELCDWRKAKNVYRVDSTLYKLLGNRIDAVGNTSINIVDGKAFGSAFNDNQSAKGFGYVSLNAGFDFTVWDKSHYWHFATLGFKEFFIRVYNQYIYLFDLQPRWENFFVDIVGEFVLELTVGYGNLSAQFCIGTALGYQGGKNIPSYGVNFNVAFGIGN